MEKPSLPKGTRDFGPVQMARRQFIFDNIRSVFQRYGFQPLETPAMENLSILEGKYGDEGDSLLFRVLESGNPVEKYREKLIKLIQTSNALFLELGDAVINQLRNGRILNVTLLLEEAMKLKFNDKDLIELLITGYSQDFIDAIEKIRGDQTQIESLKDLPKYLEDRNKTTLDLKYSLLRGILAEKGLRYDLTVPFARYVVMNRHQISFPFKRYQIQPVWRADNPQKGRYREFYQCDADVVGTPSLVCEADIILMIKDVFKGLGIQDYTIKINHRGILNGIADVIGATGNEAPMFVAIDKLDKIGEEKVKEELRAKNFSEQSLTSLFHILNAKGSNTNKLGFLAGKFETSQGGQKGLRDLREVFDLLTYYGATEANVEFDVALARGLSYYTGCIFEVKINNVSIGSVSGGGRYDNLTQAFGDKENLSGVGFSFGVDRIYDAMDELGIFPQNAQISSQVLLCHFDDESFKYSLGVLADLRRAGIASEVYPDLGKLKKQLDFANKKLIPFTVVIGSEEMNSGQLAFKNMGTGEQEKLSVSQIIAKIKS